MTGVHNHLQIALPDGDFRDDAKLTTAASNALAGNVTVPDTVDVDLHVQQALERSALVPDGGDVTAQTMNGIITLTGHVPPGPSTTRQSAPP